MNVFVVSRLQAVWEQQTALMNRKSDPESRAELATVRAQADTLQKQILASPYAHSLRAAPTATGASYRVSSVPPPASTYDSEPQYSGE
eukprot:NODE_3866_length_870_cov_76.295981_g2017_i1.p2 GENE.NODE_3866_length_870_cov_76.295981_g2017_i1~~NODE_3866_length_870_cov_76.295981_g2017_i1.p2  ORF type:complete len:88 (+),score=14.25 NODE_3866_length_870_cov_76.295981_g2017_i1:377-640(+)